MHLSYARMKLIIIFYNLKKQCYKFASILFKELIFIITKILKNAVITLIFFTAIQDGITKVLVRHENKMEYQLIKEIVKPFDIIVLLRVFYNIFSICQFLTFFFSISCHFFQFHLDFPVVWF